MEQVNISTKLLKIILDHLFVYEKTETFDDWGFDENTGDFVKKQKVERTYYLDYGEERCEISLEEYEEFLRLEALLKKEII